jgi:hypothetical protein
MRQNHKTDLAKVYDTVLSIPGMNEALKIELRIPRKNVLLLSKVIERGLAQDGEEGGAGVLDHRVFRDTGRDQCIVL